MCTQKMKDNILAVLEILSANLSPVVFLLWKVGDYLWLIDVGTVIDFLLSFSFNVFIICLSLSKSYFCMYVFCLGNYLF